MSNYLNKDLLRTWTPEQRNEYQKALQRRMADLAMFHAQLVEVRVEEGDYERTLD